MPYNELRKNYLLNHWVIIAIERSRRPTDFAKPKTDPAKGAVCPLCPGNEHMTPPALLVYLKGENREIIKEKDRDGFRHKNWIIRCIPNLYPAFTPPKQPSDTAEIFRNADFALAIGHHEVLVESPKHSDHPSDADKTQILHVLHAYQDRLGEIAQKPYVQYVQIFRNHGLEAGASLSHAHSQIIATPFLPATLKEEQEATQKYFKEKGSCFFCDLISKETESQRLITQNQNFTVIAPYASINPMEFWIIPKRHSQNILDMNQTETETLAQTLQTTMKALKTLVNDPPYNYGFHIALDKQAANHYHWHLEVYPKLAIWAGFEKSTGMYINTVPPETAAQELKKTLNA